MTAAPVKCTEADLDARISEWRAAWNDAQSSANPFGEPVKRVRLNLGAAAVACFLAAFWIYAITAIAWGIQ